jgi:hypothetical protein
MQDSDIRIRNRDGRRGGPAQMGAAPQSSNSHHAKNKFPSTNSTIRAGAQALAVANNSRM